MATEKTGEPLAEGRGPAEDGGSRRDVDALADASVGHAAHSIPTSPADLAGGARSEDGGIDPRSPQVRAFFGSRYEAVAGYASLLAEQGTVRGLVGPREVPRLWERHILNCAAVARLLPSRGTVVDLGSGAGLPGIVLAAMRPELQFVLLEPMERRTLWLEEVRDRLGLANVEVRRGRAEEQRGELTSDVVTARAVASMDRLAGWALPLLGEGGELLAMKGDRAGDELASARPVVAAWGGGAGEIVSVGTLAGVASTTVVRVVRERLLSPAAPPRGGRTTRRR